jgi:hypothetical protein
MYVRERPATIKDVSIRRGIASMRHLTGSEFGG